MLAVFDAELKAAGCSWDSLADRHICDKMQVDDTSLDVCLQGLLYDNDFSGSEVQQQQKVFRI